MQSRLARVGRAFAFASAALAALLITGCGGGGGGSAGAPEVAAGTATASGAVTVGPPSPSKITATRVVGERITEATFTGVVTGDVASLQDKQIYLTVEDPSQLFQETAYLTLTRTATGLNYSLVLGGRDLTTSGHFTGNLRILACVDPACRQPLGGTPLVVPYDVTVQEGLTLSRQDVSVTVPFGTVTPVETINVGWPSAAANGWILRGTTPYDPQVPVHLDVLDGIGAWTTSPVLRLQMQLAPPGTYTDTLEVMSTAKYANGSEHDYKKTVTIHYTVTPNPAVDYGVWPAAQIQLTHKASDNTVSYYNYRVVTNIGISASFLGVDYLSGAGSTGPTNGWWSEFPYRGSFQTCVDNKCLQPGVYTAQLRYRLTTPSGTRDIAIPVTLTATP
jgi:hypothetical protein